MDDELGLTVAAIYEAAEQTKKHGQRDYRERQLALGRGALYAAAGFLRVFDRFVTAITPKEEH